MIILECSSDLARAKAKFLSKTQGILSPAKLHTSQK